MHLIQFSLQAFDLALVLVQLQDNLVDLLGVQGFPFGPFLLPLLHVPFLLIFKQVHLLGELLGSHLGAGQVRSVLIELLLCFVQLSVLLD